MSIADVAGRVLGGRLKARLAPLAGRLAALAGGSAQRDVSRRMTVVAFATRIAGAFIAYASQVLLARWMGDFEYGIFVAVWVAAVILGGLVCLGFQTAIIRFVPEYIARGEPDLLRGALRASRAYALASATLFAGLGMLALHLLGDRITGYYVIPLFLGAATLPMLALGEVYDGITRAFSWAGLSLWPGFIVRPLLILAAMAAAVLLGFKPDAVTAMGSVIVAVYATTATQIVLTQLRLRTVVPAGPRRYRTPHWIGIALPVFVVEGFFNLLTNIDILMVGWFMPPDQVAVYFAAARTLALVHFVYFAVRAGSAQQFSRCYADGNTAELKSFTRQAVIWTFWPSVAMVLVLLVAGRPILSLFGPEFVTGYPLLFIISVGLLARASIGPGESLLLMADQHRICAVIFAAAFAVAVCLNAVLIPALGLTGAAIATATALVVEAAALYAAIRARFGVHSFILAPRPAGAPPEDR